MKPESREILSLSLSYFLFFAILGIFLPYFNLYCYDLKFSSRQIGFLSASLSLMKLVSPLFWTYLADHVWSRKKISLTTSLVSAAIFFLCIFIRDFKSMLIAISLYGFFRTAMVPLIEASTWETIETQGGEYGKIRLWGSVGFIFAALTGGWALDHLPLASALYGITFLSFLIFLTALKIPKEMALESDQRTKDPLLPLLAKPSLFVFMLIATLTQISHGTYYGFFTIYMEELGFSRSVIGLSWSLSVICEIILFTRYQRWFGNVNPKAMLILACFIATWRWWLMAYSTSLVFILFAQGLHAFSFAAFHVASLTDLNKSVPSRLRATGQGLLSSISYGLGGTVGLGLSGLFYDSLGAKGLFTLSSLFSFWAGMTAVCYYFYSLRKSHGQT